jgi:acyl-coenzyme A thioesterase 13
MVDAYRQTDFSLTVDDRIRTYKACITTDAAYTGFDTALLQRVTYLASNPEKQQTTFEFQVADFMCNKDGNLHGGAASALFDNLSSTALYTIGRPGFWDNLGVTRSLSVRYHRPLPKSTTVRMICHVVAAGKRMATVAAVMETTDGKVCASCVHDKYYMQVSM